MQKSYFKWSILTKRPTKIAGAYGIFVFGKVVQMMGNTLIVLHKKVNTARCIGSNVEAG